MALQFAPGDDLIFQLESGYGLLRVVAAEERDGEAVWHLSAYEELFPDVESAEAALSDSSLLTPRATHLALTDRALAKTPAARLGNRPVREEELAPLREWRERGGVAEERSALLLLGLR
ncbi:MAG: hypothetical protein LC785_00495 [Acidobacteria bacterium]|nr:hypothetical protein [Acidobacteriota bacterium]MCA1640471.1 hypothetical protein [Acidobacteriota bacterium]